MTVMTLNVNGGTVLHRPARLRELLVDQHPGLGLGCTPIFGHTAKIAVICDGDKTAVLTRTSGPGTSESRSSTTHFTLEVSDQPLTSLNRSRLGEPPRPNA